MSITEMKILQRKLDDINSAINGLLILVLEDFLEITKMIRERPKGMNDHPENEYISNLIQELQYYDILHQKATHMKTIHEWIQKDVEKYTPSFSSADENRTNLIRLNQLQYQISVSDFIQSIHKIQGVLSHDEATRFLQITHTHKLFMHINLIQSANRLIDSAFSNAVSLTKGWEALRLDERLKSCTLLYSMASERYVLQAYLKNPSIEHHEIATLHSTEDIDIDLF